MWLITYSLTLIRFFRLIINSDRAICPLVPPAATPDQAPQCLPNMKVGNFIDIIYGMFLKTEKW